MAPIGDKLRSARLDLGLSQQQLAGKEVSRAFISQVESGKCTPSMETLRVLAQRLSKPVEFFLQEEVPDESLEVAVALLDSAEKDLAHRQPEHLAAAERKLNRAMQWIAECRQPELEGRGRLLRIRFLQQTGRLEETREECEQALACFLALGDGATVARIYATLGQTAYYLEDLHGARRAYDKAVLYASGLKTMLRFRVESLMFLGSCLVLLGQLPEAIARYQEALSECEALDAPELWGRLAMGLGWVLYDQGDASVAKKWTERAIKALHKAGSAEEVLAQHNLAVIEAARGNRERAYVILQECLRIYRSTGQLAKQASALEELSQYWQHKGDLERAEDHCWSALDLLDAQDDGILRGRLYRLLGIMAEQKGSSVQAQRLLRMSVDLLRRMKATGEAAASAEQLERVKREANL